MWFAKLALPTTLTTYGSYQQMSTIYLYIKSCPHCGIKYFGKTIQNPYVYARSGKYWLRHLKKHNAKAQTIEVWEFDSQEDCTAFALQFSHNNNIVESNDWANLKPETATDGGVFLVGWNHTEESKLKISKAMSGRKKAPLTDSHKAKISAASKGRKLSDQTRQRQSAAKKGHAVSEETRRKLSEAWHRNNAKKVTSYEF